MSKIIHHCPIKYESDEPCPACGATVKGNDPVRGICQARNGFKEPDVSVIMEQRFASTK